MRIGQLAEKTGVPVRTIRYYDEIGLLPASCRTQSGYRKFSEGHVRALSFVRTAQHLGMTLAQISAILESARQEESVCSCVRSTIEKNIEHLDARIARLQATRDQLAATRERLAYAASASSSDASVCPAIESIEISPETRLDSPLDWRE